MAYCDTCDRSFGSHRSLVQHWVNSSRHNYCELCGRHYTTWPILREHQEVTHHYCKTHDESFNSWPDLAEHYVEDSDHDYCRRCDKHFYDSDDLEEHEDENHWPCRSCGIVYFEPTVYKQHLRSAHWYCEPCNRIFQNQNNLNMHLNSSTHKPRTFLCPGRGCGRSFISASDRILHFESGTCPSGISRQELNRRVVEMDRNNIITNPNRLITGPGGYVAPQEQQLFATECSWNYQEQAYQCYLCRRLFQRLNSLNQHLSSPAHQADIYRCPGNTCSKEFGTLSGLCSHVERGNCGALEQRVIRNAYDSLIGGMKLLAL